MRWLTAIVLLWSVTTQGSTPDDSVARKNSRYFFSVRSGMAFCGHCAFDGPATGYLTTVHGVRLTPAIGIGAGVGVTVAAEQVIIPVFGSLNVALLGTKNKLFAELNYGLAGSPWGTSREDGLTETMKVSSYFQPSIGYKIPYHDLRIGILLGVQSLKLKRTATWPGGAWAWGTNRVGTPNSSDFKYNVSRFVLGFSVGWRD